MDADGSNRKQLTDDPRYRDEYPRPTADGTSVLFTRIDLESEDSDTSFWLLELATGKLTTVVDDFDAPAQLATAWPRLLDWWQPH
jgi:Tol biopolymer transport system component